MLSAAWPSRGFMGGLLRSCHPSNCEPGGPDTPASHMASATSIFPRARAALHPRTIAGFWQGAGGGSSDSDTNLRLDCGWRRGCCCRPDSPSSPFTLRPLLLLPQSHPQLQQPESSGSASFRFPLRGQSTAHHQVLKLWQVLPMSGS